MQDARVGICDRGRNARGETQPNLPMQLASDPGQRELEACLRPRLGDRVDLNLISRKQLKLISQLTAFIEFVVF